MRVPDLQATHTTKHVARSRTRFIVYPSLLAVVAFAFAPAGCGRPATVEDCEKIVQRVTELELKKVAVSDQLAVAQQVTGAKNAFRERMMTDCVGRRLRQSSLDCVNNATTASQIVRECF